jgi:hypothetical protein
MDILKLKIFFVKLQPFIVTVKSLLHQKINNRTINSFPRFPHPNDSGLSQLLSRDLPKEIVALAQACGQRTKRFPATLNVDSLFEPPNFVVATKHPLPTLDTKHLGILLTIFFPRLMKAALHPFYIFNHENIEREPFCTANKYCLNVLGLKMCTTCTQNFLCSNCHKDQKMCSQCITDLEERDKQKPENEMSPGDKLVWGSFDQDSPEDYLHYTQRAEKNNPYTGSGFAEPNEPPTGSFWHTFSPEDQVISIDDKVELLQLYTTENLGPKPPFRSIELYSREALNIQNLGTDQCMQLYDYLFILYKYLLHMAKTTPPTQPATKHEDPPPPRGHGTCFL